LRLRRKWTPTKYSPRATVLAPSCRAPFTGGFSAVPQYPAYTSERRSRSGQQPHPQAATVAVWLFHDTPNEPDKIVSGDQPDAETLPQGLKRRLSDIGCGADWGRLGPPQTQRKAGVSHVRLRAG
jgi:hypothetical protein